LEQRAVRLEIGEVVLLLEARVLDELRRARTVRAKALRWDRLGDDHLRRCATAELVLERRELVVERRRARDAEASRRQRQLVRTVCERDVEASPLGEAVQPAEAPGHLPNLLKARPAAVSPD